MLNEHCSLTNLALKHHYTEQAKKKLVFKELYQHFFFLDFPEEKKRLFVIY